MNDTEVKKKIENSEINDAEAKKKKKFKMPSALAIIIAILFGLVILSWILSWVGVSNTVDAYTIDIDAAFFENLNAQLVAAGIAAIPQDTIDEILNIIGPDAVLDVDAVTTYVEALGIFGVGVAMANGFVNGADLIFYLLILGAVIELMLVSGSMEAGISGLVKGFNGKELLLIPLLLTLFSAGGTIYGMSEETIALFVIVVPALALAGFDCAVGMMVILGGTATGCAMSTVNPFAVGAASGAINDQMVYNQGTTLFLTLGWWIVLTAIVASLVTAYAWHVKKSPEKSINKIMKVEADEWLKSFDKGGDKENATWRQKSALGVFGVAFMLMVILFVPWQDIIPGFTYNTGTGDPLFGLIATLGTWYFAELSMLFLVAGAIIVLLLNMGTEKSTSAMWAGAKGMLSVAIIIGVARGIPYIMETTGLQIVLVGGMIGAMGNISPLMFLYISFFILLALATVITSTSGLAGATMGLFAAAVIGLTSDGGNEAWQNIDPEKYMGAIVIAYIMAAGILNFFTPTNPIVMVSMSSSKVAYTDGVKVMAPIAGVMLLVTLFGILPSTMLMWA